MSSTSHGGTPYYFVPGPSSHPVMAAIGLFFVFFGAGQWINGVAWGEYSLYFGLVWLFVMLFRWFRDAVSESEGGSYGHKVDLSFRWSMSWFIFSEVMFFGAFFTALWWVRVHSVPELGSVENALVVARFQGGLAQRGGRCHRRRRQASSSRSRPWARSGCRPSTRRCC